MKENTKPQLLKKNRGLVFNLRLNFSLLPNKLEPVVVFQQLCGG